MLNNAFYHLLQFLHFEEAFLAHHMVIESAATLRYVVD